MAALMITMPVASGSGAPGWILNNHWLPGSGVRLLEHLLGALRAALGEAAVDCASGREPHHDADKKDQALGDGQRPDDPGEPEPHVAKEHDRDEQDAL